MALAATALGACIIEKHFTLDKSLPGPDHQASLSPDELLVLVKGIRTVEAALGDDRKAPVLAEEDVRHVARRSLALLTDQPAGTVLTEAHLTALRPSGGIIPANLDLVIGRRLSRAVHAGDILSWNDLS